MIIHIQGVCGSGKSYILSQLNVMTKDTDEFFFDAIDELIDAGTRLSNEVIEKLACKKRDDFMSCVVGVDMVYAGADDIPGADRRYFIKIRKKKLSMCYQVYLLRELDKLTTGERTIRRVIRNGGSSVEILNSVRMMGTFPGVSYTEYVEEYHSAAKHYQKEGYILITQSKLLKKMKRLF